MRYFTEDKQGEITTVFQFALDGEDIPSGLVEIHTDDTPSKLCNEYAIIDSELVFIGEKPKGVPVTLDVDLKQWIPNVEPLKYILRSKINDERYKRSIAPINYMGAFFDADEKAQSNIIGWQTQILAGYVLPDNFVWRDTANIDHAADSDFVNGLAVAIALRNTALYQAAWAKKAVIDTLSIDDLLSYVVEAGW